MQFTQLPVPYAPLGGPVTYAVNGISGSDLEVRITDASRILRYGAKRFAAVTEAAFDVAPYLRRAIRFVPAAGNTGLYDTESRTPNVVVEVIDTGTQEQLRAPARLVLPAAEAAPDTGILTTMPTNRILSPGETDEVTLRTDGPLTLTLTAEYGPHVAVEEHPVPAAGLWIFLLNTADFPNAERITLNAGACGTVVWTVVPAVEGAVRLAWRSRAGSVEHYDFPVELASTLEAKKQTAYGPRGYVSCASVERSRTLRSALERSEVLEALAELIHTPEVWLVTPNGYEPISVVSDRAVVRPYGTLGSLDLVIRPNTKPAQPWN